MKDPMSMQILIEAFTKPKDIVLDTYASTCDKHFHSHSCKNLTKEGFCLDYMLTLSIYECQKLPFMLANVVDATSWHLRVILLFMMRSWLLFTTTQHQTPPQMQLI